MKKFLLSLSSIILSVVMLLGVVGCGETPTVAVTDVSIPGGGNKTVTVGGTTKLRASVKPSNATDKTVTWESDDETIVTVDENGKVTAIAAGSTKVRVITNDGGHEDEVTVTVTAAACTTHVDANPKDAKCDVCGATVACTTHVDANHDLKCDVCGATVACTTHVDANPKDAKCDYCDATVACTTHVDEGHDFICDVCGEFAGCVEHADSNPRDGKCDWCDEEVGCIHVDANHDLKCDYCDATVACTSHVDTNPQDNKCDYCNADMATCNEHVDANHDQKCDNCGATVECTHLSADLSADKDDTCDWCKQPLPDSMKHKTHVDANTDNKCDVCGADMGGGSTEHTCSDANNDCKCDECGEDIAHVDTNPKDNKCDVCKKDLNCAHVDGDFNCECDLCGEEYHANEDGDWECDSCYAPLRDCTVEGHIDNPKQYDGICEACGTSFEMPLLVVVLGTSADTEALYTQMGEYYNANISDGSHLLKLTLTSNVSTLAGSYLSGGTADVTEANDQTIKQYMYSDFLLDLNPYVESGKLDISGMYPSAINRLRLKIETGEAGSPDLPLYGVPNGMSPVVAAYNKTAMKAANINIISVAEADLDAYNEENGTYYLPHGFYMYTMDNLPEDTLKETTLKGDKGYFVFNDQIPMNWEELKQIGEYFTQSHNPSSTTRYGYYSEWWFNYGWSVGGDCLENGQDGKLKFTLADKTPNYLVTGDYTGEFSGKAYKAGELLSYVDKLDVTDMTNLYEISSQFEAFKEFCSLSMSTTQRVTNAGDMGYGISPNPSTISSSSRASVLTSKLACIVAMGINEVGDLINAAQSGNIEFGICPLAQYREYDEKDGTLKMVNGTPVTGTMATHDNQSTMMISEKTKMANAAVQFVNWWTGEEGQREVIKSGRVIANRASINADPEVQATLREKFACENMSPVIGIAASSFQGDWGYVNDGLWINAWSTKLNGDVRNGITTLDDFWRDYEEPTNILLNDYTIKKFR